MVPPDPDDDDMWDIEQQADGAESSIESKEIVSSVLPSWSTHLIRQNTA
jgi:hypothetical protein